MLKAIFVTKRWWSRFCTITLSISWFISSGWKSWANRYKNRWNITIIMLTVFCVWLALCASLTLKILFLVFSLSFMAISLKFYTLKVFRSVYRKVFTVKVSWWWNRFLSICKKFSRIGVLFCCVILIRLARIRRAIWAKIRKVFRIIWCYISFRLL